MSVASGGELDPPAGAVSPTMKDLDDVEPRQIIRNDPDPFTPIVITQSGSYYLGENINALPIQHGIEITASNVTLDLNGFTITGDTDAGSLDGIHVTGNISGVIIRNGRVRLFVEDGVDFNLSERGIVEDVIAENCGGDGFFLLDESFAVNCKALSNGGNGFSINGNGETRGCLARSNSADGFIGGPSSSFFDCVSRNNTGSGFHLTFQRGVIMDCNARFNNIGYDVDDIKNTIVRNITFSNTTNYDVIAGNDLGTVVNSPAGAGAWDNLDL